MIPAPVQVPALMLPLLSGGLKMRPLLLLEPPYESNGSDGLGLDWAITGILPLIQLLEISVGQSMMLLQLQ